MATGTAGTNARRYHHCMMHYLRKTIAYTDGSAVVTVGTLPAGAVVDRVSTTVVTVFNAATTNTVSVGTVAVPTAYGATAALGTVAVVTGTITAAQAYRPTDTVVVATIAMTGAAATTGQAIITVSFTVDNDG